MTHNMRQLIDNLGTLTPSLRLGLASFRDYGDRSGTSTDRPFMVNVPLTSETEKVRAELSRLRADNGGDTPESLATAVKAVVDGKEHPPYFGASDMGFSADPDRIKIVLGVTDAMNRRERLPRGAPDLSQVAALLKERGVLFLGIGYKRSRSSRASEDVAEAVGASMEGSLGVRARSRAKVAKTVKRGPAEWTLEAGSNDQSSFGDLAYLARMTGAIAKSPGVDLDGDGKTETYGEIAPGEPAVLLMTPRGELEGAPSSSNPTRVLADAITAMVERVRPFQFRLALSAEGRSLDPEADSIAVAPESEYQGCFVPVTIGARSNPAIGACPVMTEVRASIEELSSVTAVDPANLKAVLEVAPNCLGLPRPEPKPDPTAHPSPVPPVCRGPGCGGGAVGI
ncbi:MAG: hypothetical protein NDJ89_03875 [Oligoflexia bacterium]|nr:hypothetical protein [Oligoflexia bacterium]